MPCHIGTLSPNKKWLSLDICGLGCASLSYSFHLYAIYTIYTTLISFSKSAAFVFYILYLPCSLLALGNLIMAQHTDPGSIPIGARPLRVEDEVEVEVGEEEAEGSDKNDEVSVQSACLLKRDGNGIDTSIIVGKGIALDDDEEEEDCSGKLKLAQGKQETLKVGGGLDGNIPSGSGSGTGSARIERKKVQRRRGIRRCRKCGNNYKPPRSHHDSVTGRCISKFDHYCPVSQRTNHCLLD